MKKAFSQALKTLLIICVSIVLFIPARAQENEPMEQMPASRYIFDVFDSSRYPMQIHYAHDSIAVTDFSMLNPDYKIFMMHSYPPKKRGRNVYVYDKVFGYRLMSKENLMIDSLPFGFDHQNIIKVTTNSYMIGNGNNAYLVNLQENNHQLKHLQSTQSADKYKLVASLAEGKLYYRGKKNQAEKLAWYFEDENGLMEIIKLKRKDAVVTNEYGQLYWSKNKVIYHNNKLYINAEQHNQLIIFDLQTKKTELLSMPPLEEEQIQSVLFDYESNKAWLIKYTGKNKSATYSFDLNSGESRFLESNEFIPQQIVDNHYYFLEMVFVKQILIKIPLLYRPEEDHVQLIRD